MLSLGLHLFGDDAYVRLHFKCAFERYVGCRTSHKFYEVVVFLCGVAVTLDVADHLGIHLACRVKSERGLDPLVLEVAVDGFRNAYHLYVRSVGLVVFRKHGGVGV